LKKVVAENADCDLAYAVLGNLYAKEKKWTEARRNFQLAVEHCWEVAKANEYRAAIAEIDESIGSADSSAASEPITAIDFLNRGDARARHEEYGKAVADYTKAIELNPGSAQALLHRGYSLERQGQNNNALADFQAALRLDPRETAGYECLGRFYEESGHYPEAVLNLQKAVQLGTHEPGVYAHLAWILLNGPSYLRDNQRGLDAARKACVLSDWKESGPVVYLVYGYVLQKDYASAVGLAKMALSLPDLTKENEKYLRQVIAYSENRNTSSASGAESISLNNLISTNRPPRTAASQVPDLAQLKKLAQSGDHKAQARLANCFYASQNASVADHAEAYKWAALAASAGDRDGIAFQREFDLFMSPAEIAAGKAAATAFLKETAKTK
jgi:tetratricopeptide (TPR) repeat protein